MSIIINPNFRGRRLAYTLHTYRNHLEGCEKQEEGYGTLIELCLIEGADGESDVVAIILSDQGTILTKYYTNIRFLPLETT